MSRIGRKPVIVPAGVDVKLDGTTLTVKGPKGTLTNTFNQHMIIRLEGNEVIVERPNEDKFYKSLHGLTRTIIANMIEGVVNGYSKKLEINGVGYRAAKQGDKVNLTLGFSHPVVVSENADIKLDVPDATTIIVNGIDKQKVGQFAAEIREKKPPEPYKGKGIRYAGEYVIHKEGKAAKGKK